jgi:uncharacterized protein YebE (UPF0316 family)
MATPDFITSDIFAWVILPVLIVFARICDVSLDTLRMIFISKGFKSLAPLLGFFEVIIWLLAIGQIMQHLDNIVCYIAYGLGFALGNYLGMYLDEKLLIGNVIIRVIAGSDSTALISELKSQNFGLTVVDAEGAQQKVKLIFSVIKRENIQHFVSVINLYNPHSFYTIEDVKSVNEGVFKRPRKRIINSLGFMGNKGK